MRLLDSLSKRCGHLRRSAAERRLRREVAALRSEADSLREQLAVAQMETRVAREEIQVLTRGLEETRTAVQASIAANARMMATGGRYQPPDEDV